ncbi:MAG TPA: 30S ribosomal protein S17 [Planctomycetaceae bacterium]|nr:30S ribosomal protein S17 [Planctomycetaceae bacterium]HUG19751.1 30S ribosomal protein S17 [Planctomycetaceae bacterium]
MKTKKKLIGTVVSDKADKTIRVDIERRFRHRKYGKIVRSKTVCYAHDEKNEAKEGDRVEIIESRPHSRLKRWELVQIVERFAELGTPS